MGCCLGLGLISRSHDGVGGGVEVSLVLRGLTCGSGEPLREEVLLDVLPPLLVNGPFAELDDLATQMLAGVLERGQGDVGELGVVEGLLIHAESVAASFDLSDEVGPCVGDADLSHHLQAGCLDVLRLVGAAHVVTDQVLEELMRRRDAAGGVDIRVDDVFAYRNGDVLHEGLLDVLVELEACDVVVVLRLALREGVRLACGNGSRRGRNDAHGNLEGILFMVLRDAQHDE